MTELQEAVFALIVIGSVTIVLFVIVLFIERRVKNGIFELIFGKNPSQKSVDKVMIAIAKDIWQKRSMVLEDDVPWYGREQMRIFEFYKDIIKGKKYTILDTPADYMRYIDEPAQEVADQL
jgi:hypothetical protein